MEAVKQLHRDRIEAALHLLERVLSGAVTSRSALVAELQELYSRRGLEPFRGLSREGVYDKEVATVYLVGVYGAGVIAPGDFDNVFYIENKSMEAVELIRSIAEVVAPEQRDALRGKTEEIKGKSVEDRVFRVLRLVFTGAVLGYYPEMFLVKALRTYEAVYPELSERLVNYAAFYSAYKIAEDIAAGRIRTPEDLKIQKYSYCLKLGFQKCKPSDKLIAEVASAIYRVNKSVLAKLFAKGALPKLE
ncbi:DUF2192 domain-containing protein [Pyrobaculum neutrophilum]|uniref:DUF2192 domain-containing protein n=1 Tax=Pyrobaculum neutrophilum (strain DSM 2338 / JCM 9278 / NBRC 100436 / V24Sta) TaxID=444157 RepID=B1YDH7_PYRNV|nr:DUF2192 domain-containing protein [Pyrobaculum neutrophilum]ACB39840.1 conserved hypothetical protein [Pyrobaculum neutrophilum V24Sta]